MWNIAVNNILYPIYPLSRRAEKGYITKIVPFFFCSVYVTYDSPFSHTRQWMIEQAHEIQLWMLRVYYISRQLYYIGHVTSIVFHCFLGRPHPLAPLTSLWRHDFYPDTPSAGDRRSLFRIFLSIIYGIGHLWRLWRRFAVCSFRTNQNFWCWIQISYYFFNLSKINFAELKQK